MDQVTDGRSKFVSPLREIGNSNDSRAQAARVVALIEEGATLPQALDVVGMKRTMFGAAINSQQELAVRYARARELSADFLVDEALEVVKTEPDVQRAREIANMHRWAASKFNTKRYGDRVDLNISQSLDVSGVIAEARERRLRLTSDPAIDVEAQTVDTPSLPSPQPRDKESRALFGPDDKAQIAAMPGDEPDIFS